MTGQDLSGRWTAENRGALRALLAKSFQPRPIAVFDWDNTCIQGDTSDAVFHQMCRELAFRFDHPGFQQWVEEIPVPTRILECLEMYWAHPSPESAAALRFELERTRWALHESEDDNQAWAWDSGAFVGWTPAQVRDYTKRVIEQELALPMGQEILTHPAHMEPEAIGAGAVKQDLSGLHYLERARRMREMQVDSDMTLPLRRGLRERAEMRDLISAMRNSGWDIFVITASPQWEVEAFAERYSIAPQRVIGMRRSVVNGQITAEIEPPCSWGDGKLDAYQMFVTRERPPNFCAGDSIGDWTLLEWATDCALLVEPTIDSLRNFAQWRQSLGETWLIQAFE
jgi:phosphoserine phosphatase